MVRLNCQLYEIQDRLREKHLGMPAEDDLEEAKHSRTTKPTMVGISPHAGALDLTRRRKGASTRMRLALLQNSACDVISRLTLFPP